MGLRKELLDIDGDVALTYAEGLLARYRDMPEEEFDREFSSVLSDCDGLSRLVLDLDRTITDMGGFEWATEAEKEAFTMGATFMLHLLMNIGNIQELPVVD